MNSKKGAILIIEDEIAIAEAIGEYLENYGYQVFFARSATEAIQKTQNQTFMCIITDINLEKGTGDTVILNIKNSFGGYNYSTPIIVVSSALNMKLMAKIKDVIDWAFVKPYSLEALIEKIDEVVSKPAKIHK